MMPSSPAEPATLTMDTMDTLDLYTTYRKMFATLDDERVVWWYCGGVTAPLPNLPTRRETGAGGFWDGSDGQENGQGLGQQARQAA